MEQNVEGVAHGTGHLLEEGGGIGMEQSVEGPKCVDRPIVSRPQTKTHCAGTGIKVQALSGVRWEEGNMDK